MFILISSVSPRHFPENLKLKVGLSRICLNSLKHSLVKLFQNFKPSWEYWGKIGLIYIYRYIYKIHISIYKVYISIYINILHILHIYCISYIRYIHMHIYISKYVYMWIYIIPITDQMTIFNFLVRWVLYAKSLSMILSLLLVSAVAAGLWFTCDR